MTEAICVLPHRHEPERPRRAMDGLYVCAGCHAGLERSVAELPALHERLVERLSPASARSVGGPPAGLSSERAAINGPVADHREQMRRVAASWARLTAEERGLVGPATPRLENVSAWLLGSLTWACAQPWIDDYADEMNKLAGRARALIAANPRRRFVVGNCPERNRDEDGTDLGPCQGTLTASIARRDDLLPSEVSCDVDAEHVWTPSRWSALSKKLGVKFDEDATRRLVDVLADRRGA